MSQYSFEEICEHCKFAHWHSCSKCYGSYPSFCHCEIQHESQINHSTRECSVKQLQNKCFTEGE